MATLVCFSQKPLYSPWRRGKWHWCQNKYTQELTVSTHLKVDCKWRNLQGFQNWTGLSGYCIIQMHNSDSWIKSCKSTNIIPTDLWKFIRCFTLLIFPGWTYVTISIQYHIQNLYANTCISPRGVLLSNLCMQCARLILIAAVTQGITDTPMKVVCYLFWKIFTLHEDL